MKGSDLHHLCVPHLPDKKSAVNARIAGKYLTVYAKQGDGTWKIVGDMNNPNAPAAPPSAEK